MNSPTLSAQCFVKTLDGVELNCIRAGPSNGRNVLFIAGWRQPVASWKKQVAAFSQKGFRVTAFDYRGHGDSAKPSFGYTIARFGADLRDVLVQLDLKSVSVVAHSMGSSVVWSFWSNFPEERHRLERFAIVDQSTVLVRNPTWNQSERETFAAALFSPAGVYEFCAVLPTKLEEFIRSMFSADVSEDDFTWFLTENKKMSNENAATLLINHAFADWRNTIPLVDIPTLVIAGEASLNKASSIVWAATQMPNARQRTFSKEERGSHFMFWENPGLFNSVLEEFIDAPVDYARSQSVRR
ncbi:AB hydrolase superfamily protein YdjP [Cyphellophora attinorum]|uniref:AB hydrolase superfamily protein YdjP n=1 Tax=Cyphellophora attinorum TaxID=1664694 RepID=A0A0N0NNE9_9EURO|nr:AB hydrolase superfamily protein YdjP [Phialophora attinorum]KPI41448.1 AB hydrolase superfamily protein YdjP [Phialophora attinorum]